MCFLVLLLGHIKTVRQEGRSYYTGVVEGVKLVEGEGVWGGEDTGMRVEVRVDNRYSGVANGNCGRVSTTGCINNWWHICPVCYPVFFTGRFTQRIAAIKLCAGNPQFAIPLLFSVHVDSLFKLTHCKIFNFCINNKCTLNCTVKYRLRVLLTD